MNISQAAKNGHRTWLLVLLAAMALSLAVGTVPAYGQGIEPEEGQATGKVQALSGHAVKGANVFYTLPDLNEGQVLTVYMASTSGNLDPLTGLTDARIEGDALKEAFFGDVARVTAEGRDPLEALPEIYDKYFLAWDDDSGAGYGATFEFAVPADGDCQLMVSRSPMQDTKGDFRLLMGVDAPQVLSGDAVDTGDTIAFLDETTSQSITYVQELTGSLSEQEPDEVLTLRPLREGDVFSAIVVATSGDTAPAQRQSGHFAHKRVRI